jgi:hypothetical protein
MINLTNKLNNLESFLRLNGFNTEAKDLAILNKIAARQTYIPRDLIEDISEKLYQAASSSLSHIPDNAIISNYSNRVYYVSSNDVAIIPIKRYGYEKEEFFKVTWGFNTHSQAGVNFEDKLIVIFLASTRKDKKTALEDFKEVAPILLSHEISHVRDNRWPSKPSTKMTPLEYHNDESEAKAFLTQIYHEIYDLIPSLYDRGVSLSDATIELINSSRTWNIINVHLNKKNKNRYLKAMYTMIQDYYEEMDEMKFK